jgi:thiol-disulfide isomerase/thioredoxin
MASTKSSDRVDGARKPFWTLSRVVLTLAGLGLVGALGLSSCNSKDATVGNSPANPANTAAPPKVVNATAPPASVNLPNGLRDTTMQTIEGKSLKLSDYDKKVVIVNLWATWCGPCRQEMPELVRMSSEYKSRGLVVLGMATSYNERRGIDYVKDFVKEQGIPYEIIWDDGTVSNPLVQAVQGRAVIPQSFVISRDGRIVKHFSGFSSDMTPQLMRHAIEEALNDKT